MGQINQVAISGNLTRAPELKASRNGTFMALFCVAVNDGYGEKLTVSYFDCVRYLGNNPSQAQQNFWSNLEKGRRVFVCGKLRESRWEKDGQKRSKVEIVVHELDTQARPAVDPSVYAPGQQMPIAAAPPQQPAPEQELYDDEIPF